MITALEGTLLFAFIAIAICMRGIRHKATSEETTETTETFEDSAVTAIEHEHYNVPQKSPTEEEENNLPSYSEVENSF